MTAEASEWTEGTRVPSRVYGPVRSAVVATLVAAVVFGIVLEALVFTSFIGQRLWNDPALFRELTFTLPLLLWALVDGFVAVLALRALTAWIQVDRDGVGTRGLFRRAVRTPWTDVSRVVAVRDIQRGRAERIDLGGGAYDGLYLVGADGAEILTVTGRLFGARAQNSVLVHATSANVPIEVIEEIGPRELLSRVPRSMGLIERYPALLLVLIALFYVAHTVLTLIIWGL